MTLVHRGARIPRQRGVLFPRLLSHMESCHWITETFRVLLRTLRTFVKMLLLHHLIMLFKYLKFPPPLSLSNHSHQEMQPHEEVAAPPQVCIRSPLEQHRKHKASSTTTPFKGLHRREPSSPEKFLLHPEGQLRGASHPFLGT